MLYTLQVMFLALLILTTPPTRVPLCLRVASLLPAQVSQLSLSLSLSPSLSLSLSLTFLIMTCRVTSCDPRDYVS